MNLIGPSEFILRAGTIPVVDVRSPAEYASGHIPGAVNIPLFDNEQRAEIGILYKRSGREESILRGLEIVGPKLADFIKAVRKLAPGRKVLVHCWRGGMRSANMAWLFELNGFEVSVLEGGYKAYRRYIREYLNGFGKLVVIGGKTGSGKTCVLEGIEKIGFQVIDLEKIAHHKGSAFGDLGQEPQPTTEQFENNLFQAAAGLEPGKITYVEDESRGIGKISIPDYFYKAMRSSHVIFLDVPKEERIKRLVQEYSGFPRERLASAINRIQKKLGGLNCKLALEALENNDFTTVTDILLTYYDRAYLKGLSMRSPDRISHIRVDHDDPEFNARIAVEYCEANLESTL